MRHGICDFETRSTCDIKRCGGWKYAEDSTTEVLCLAFKLSDWTDVYLWRPPFPSLGLPAYCDDWNKLFDFLDWIDSGGIVEAHNSQFERAIWSRIMVPRFRFPPVPHRSWRCSAAKAAALALPRKLEKVGPVLHIPVTKDMEGHKLMQKMTKPRKPRKSELEAWANQHGAGVCVVCKGKGQYKRQPCEPCKGVGALPGNPSKVPPMPTLWHESLELLERLSDYCRVDVLSEEQVSLALPDLTADEVEMYLLDQAINERGIGLDPVAIEAALATIADQTIVLNAELKQLTGGVVEKATSRDRMKAWLESQGVSVENMQGATLDTLLADNPEPTEDNDDDEAENTDADSNSDECVDTSSLPVHVRRSIEIVRTLGRSSTKKYAAMRDWMCGDNRMHGGLLYHGASTGRWTGAGVQPHNFPRGTLKKALDGHEFSMEELWQWIINQDIPQHLGAGMEMQALAQALRGALIPTPGNEFWVSDFAGIEARVLLWLAGDEEGMDIFRQHRDIYCEMASEIFGRSITKADKEQRQLGKAAILGCGYQMGWSKFIDTAWVMGQVRIDGDQSRRTVDAYRTKFWRVKQEWDGQQEAAIEATRSPGEPVPCGRVEWERDGRFLFCTLPSGRCLAYADPEVRQKATPWGEMRASLSFMGVHPKTKQWTRQWTYGGSLVENIDQAVSRDLMAHAMLACEQSEKYVPVLSVHDELISEAELGAGDMDEFNRLLTTLPEWGHGLPIEAEGWHGLRYRK